jgi:hypothetical protein
MENLDDSFSKLSLDYYKDNNPERRLAEITDFKKQNITPAIHLSNARH